MNIQFKFWFNIGFQYWVLILGSIFGFIIGFNIGFNIGFQHCVWYCIPYWVKYCVQYLGAILDSRLGSILGTDMQKDYLCPGTWIWIRKCPDNLFGQICQIKAFKIDRILWCSSKNVVKLAFIWTYLSQNTTQYQVSFFKSLISE